MGGSVDVRDEEMLTCEMVHQESEALMNGHEHGRVNVQKCGRVWMQKCGRERAHLPYPYAVPQPKHALGLHDGEDVAVTELRGEV